MALGSGSIAFNDFVTMVNERGYDISPVTDNSPFFYKFEVGMPKPVSLVFLASVILFGIIIFIPSLFRKKGTVKKKAHPKNKPHLENNLLKSVVLFSMLGMGFMLIEISFIQRFVLFLGQPILSLAILLFSLLAGAGMGSVWSGRFPPDKINKAIAMSSLSIVVMVLVYTFLLPIIFDHLLGFNLITRLAATVFILIPLGFLMGIPFPLGIRWLKEMNLGNHIPWMWGVNGVSSVLGSVMTIIVAISFGFTEAIFISAGCYFIAFLIFRKA